MNDQIIKGYVPKLVKKETQVHIELVFFFVVGLFAIAIFAIIF